MKQIAKLLIVAVAALATSPALAHHECGRFSDGENTVQLGEGQRSLNGRECRATANMDNQLMFICRNKDGSNYGRAIIHAKTLHLQINVNGKVVETSTRLEPACPVS